MDMLSVIEVLRTKRPIFHSEADFQFALAWEIKEQCPLAEIRLEYPPTNEPNKYIDILVIHNGGVYPIELKYKTKKLTAVANGEQFNLKGHGAQDLGAYDFVKDICRVEKFGTHLSGFKQGYVIWLTNDAKYWNAPINPEAGYVAFSVHHGANKNGKMTWGANLSAGTTKGREDVLTLNGHYPIDWQEYSRLTDCGAVFKYALLCVA